MFGLVDWCLRLVVVFGCCLFVYFDCFVQFCDLGLILLGYLWLLCACWVGWGQLVFPCFSL